MGKWLKFGLSLAISAGILALVFHAADSSAADVARAVAALGLGVWATYAAAQLLQGWLRAVRYRLLLAGAGVAPLPGRGRMFGVTLARNMFVTCCRRAPGSWPTGRCSTAAKACGVRIACRP